MAQFIDNVAAEVHATLLAGEAGPTKDCSECADCKEVLTDSWYRCATCTYAKSLCKSCIVKSHNSNPFHFVNEWTHTRGFWRKRELGSLGLVISLGHGGDWCKHVIGGYRNLCLVNSDGIQTIRVRFCGCKETTGALKKSETTQLLEASLWPATWKRVGSVFAMDMLRDFHSLATGGNVNAKDFFTHLQRKTNGTLPGNVEVCHLWRIIVL